jgi:hypothetical protein
MPGRLCFIILALLTVTACNSKDSTAPANGNTPATSSSATTANTSTSSSSSATAVKSKIDVCGLLASDDLKSVQGEAYKDAQRSDRQDGDFIVAQCYYALPTTANSVVLNVTTAKEGAKVPGPRKFWESTFARSSEKPRDRDKERAKEKAKSGEKREAEEEEAPAPEKIAGLGEDAYWLASRVGGALYVLKGDQFFRISVGGAGDAKSKLSKSKTLAQRVLKKL